MVAAETRGPAGEYTVVRDPGGAAVALLARQGLTMRYDRVHRVLGEGSFVLTMSEGQFGGQHVALYDLFRVEGGTIAEHWDVIEPIPPRGAWKNANGKF